MAKQADSRQRPGRVPPHPMKSPPGREWLGGIVSPPYFVTEGEPVRPELVLWLELPDGLIVGSKIYEPGDPQDFPETLSSAMKAPLVGPPRRPDRVRVADPALAEALRERFLDLIVINAPTPELTKILDAMIQDLSNGERPEPSYLESGRVSPEAVASLFAGARALYAVAPWRAAQSGHLIRLDIPALDVNAACLSIIGNPGKDFGFIIFPSIEDFDRFLETPRFGDTDEPLPDLGSSTLALHYESEEHIPAAMLREVEAHGWPIASKAAYPLVGHRDRDGVPRPLTERDVKIVSACSFSLTSFSLKHAREFKKDLPEPICESWYDDDDLEVRFTAPFEAAESFDVNLAGAPFADSAGKPGRNEPCHCGSGRKYKKCCLPLDRAGRQVSTVRESMHETDRRLTEEILIFATDVLGESWRGADRAFSDPGQASPLIEIWCAYHHSIAEGIAAQAFLEANWKSLSGLERSWIDAQLMAWLSVWEVEEVYPGRGLRLVDLLTGERREVVEKSGSESLVKNDAVLARVVDHDGVSLLCGMHSRSLPPMDAAAVCMQIRSRLRRRREIPPERLRTAENGRYMIQRWEERVKDYDLSLKRLPQMQNTDGDPLLFTTDHYSFTRGKRAAIQRKIASLEQIDFEPDGDEIVFYHLSKGPREGAGRTVVGRSVLGSDSLKLEGNSIARADALRERVESACGDLIRHRAREHSDPIGLLAKKKAAAGAPPGPIAAISSGRSRRGDKERGPGSEFPDLVRQAKETHYSTWTDIPLPALDGETPAECVRSKMGRKRVELLLKEMERNEQRMPPGERFDFSILRRKLGLKG